MINSTKDKKMSLWIAQTIKSKPEYYFMNALLGMYLLPDSRAVKFCYGYYVQIDTSVVYEHAWIEYNDIIIDPTLVMTGIALEDYIHISAGRFDREEISDYYYYNIQNKEDFDNELDCHSVCVTLNKSDEYEKTVKRIKELDFVVF